jgi:hypothetical protein
VIFQRYVDLSRINGWRGLLGEAQFARLLTAMGYVRVIKRGVPCRIVVKTERTIRGA